MTDLDQIIHEAATRLGIDHLDVQWKVSDRPGGDERNAAHVHAEPDLGNILVEYDPEAIRGQEKVTVLHESLHVAFRHVAAAIQVMPDPFVKAWLTQAFEEDCEAVAKALAR